MRCLGCNKEIPPGDDFCAECGPPVVEKERQGKVIVHRAFDGEHEDSETCWCRPKSVDADTLQDGDEIAREMAAEVYG